MYSSSKQEQDMRKNLYELELNTVDPFTETDCLAHITTFSCYIVVLI